MNRLVLCIEILWWEHHHTRLIVQSRVRIICMPFLIIMPLLDVALLRELIFSSFCMVWVCFKKALSPNTTVDSK